MGPRGRISKLSVALLIVAGTAGPATASAKIEIKRIAFNPAGKDSGTNRHLNRELVVIKNTGSTRRSIKGWRLHDKGRDHVYRFGDLVLYPGSKLMLRTGRGDDSVAVCFEGGCPPQYFNHWDLRNYVWDNSADVATLRRRAGKVVDRCRYGPSASSPKRC